MFSPLCFSITFDCKEVSDHTDDAVGLWEVFSPSILKTNWGVRVDQLKKTTELTNSVAATAVRESARHWLAAAHRNSDERSRMRDPRDGHLKNTVMSHLHENRFSFIKDKQRHFFIFQKDYGICCGFLCKQTILGDILSFLSSFANFSFKRVFQEICFESTYLLTSSQRLTFENEGLNTPCTSVLQVLLPLERFWCGGEDDGQLQCQLIILTLLFIELLTVRILDEFAVSPQSIYYRMESFLFLHLFFLHIYTHRRVFMICVFLFSLLQ